MSQVRFSPRSIFIGLALTAILGIALTLVVVAQEATDDGELVINTIDRSTEGAEVEPVPDPAAPEATAYFLFLSANTFVPYDETTAWGYGGGGCVYLTGGWPYSEHSVELPQGAEITQVRLYFYDNDLVNDAEVHLWVYPGDGTGEKIADFQSSGTPGQSWLDSAPFSHTVDNTAEALSVRLEYQAATTSDLMHCGVRIRYQYSPSISTLPLVLNGTGP